MKKILPAILVIFITAVVCSAQTAGTAGSFARMGFGARGLAMGNSLTAVTKGDLNPYYNPAVSAFVVNRSASATFTFLSLDRSLNFLNYIQSVKPTAGISFGLINAGVGNIDGRDGDGNHTENYSTYENQFFLSFSNKVHERVSFGVTIKLYHSKLFDEVKTTTVGFDLGVCVVILDNLTGGIAIQDLGSKYIWDTKDIYPDPYGMTTTDYFPNLRRIGLAYSIPGWKSLITAEFENSSEGTNILRGGIEVNPLEYLSIRSGIDRIDFSDEATGAKPSFGFAVRKPIGEYTPTLSYAFVAEPFAPRSFHILTLTVTF
jgi:hypothetical protein